MGKIIRQKLVYVILAGILVLLAGCGKEPVQETKEAEVTESTEAVEPAVTEAPKEEPKVEEPVVEKQETEEPKEVFYDRTYLEASGDTYVYRMTDQSIITEYDDLYESAFQSVVDSYTERKKWMEEDFDFGKPMKAINLGSDFEMDFGLDLNNIGYTYIDLDSDGTFELIFGVLQDAPLSWIPENDFERAFALVDGKPVKFCEGGSRDLYWLGSDGCVYESGSGGAAYSGTWRLHFDINLLKEDVDWGNEALVEDEFLGYWERPVHIQDFLNNNEESMDELAALPENQIEDDEWSKLDEEWEARRVQIEWLRMSDYIANRSMSGL